MKWLYTHSDPLWQTLVSCIFIFLISIALARVFGLRSFAKFTSYDFAVTVAIGSIMASVLTSGTSVIHGTFAMFGLLALKLLMSFIHRQWPQTDKVMSNKPILLMKGTTFLTKNMDNANVQREQIIAKLREANVLNFNQVKAVILESTGDISVLHTSDTDDRFDPALLEGVEQKT